MSLTSIPYRRSWAESLQELALKREIAGTSRIEGAEFTEPQLDLALQDETPLEALNRSQRQARSAQVAYRWIAEVPKGRPIDEELIRDVHRRIVTGCDDDHCPPGQLRARDENVTFGRPVHRGADGGAECKTAFTNLCAAVTGEFRAHDALVQGLALHYHIGAMHPFHDGNGRTARALEALILQRARLKDDLFVSMSNYYYDEKTTYLETLTEVRANGYDLTPFLKFGLQGIALQCNRLLQEIRTEVSKSLFRDVMGEMFHRLRSTKKRVIAERQLAALSILLEEDSMFLEELWRALGGQYSQLKMPRRAFFRDLNHLISLGAVWAEEKNGQPVLSVRLEWATQVTETSFYETLRNLPEAKTHLILGPNIK